MGNASTVMELVVRTTTANQKEVVTTIVIVPWIIDATGDLQPFLRLHHMAMDAKSELVHALYHQLLVISDTHDIQIAQIQFIARIISATKPLWVIDLIAPLGFTAAHINSHFFGNSAGTTATIEFDGIPTQVLGGYGISGAALPGFSHPPLCWANLPVSKNVPLRFLSDVMDRMGCDKEGTASILYAKAEQLRTSKHRQDRQLLNQKAHSNVAPTIIFHNSTHLKYFLDHVSTFLQDKIPPFLLGHSDEIPKGTTTAAYADTPITIAAFMKDKTFNRYRSNAKGEGFKSLLPSTSATKSSKVDYMASLSRLLEEASKELPRDQFQEALKQLVRPYFSDSLSADIQDMQLSSSRHGSPKRKLSAMTTPRSLLRRTTIDMDKDEDSSDLTYTYETMEEDDSS
jgi:hypothetical protein